MAVKTKATVFERGDHLYIISPVSPITPSDEEIAEFAFAQELRSQAPNPHIKWLRGQYVEADVPNKNGQTLTAGEIAIKSLTPMFMPVTVMHDVRSAVGVIADTRLLVPEKDSVPHSRIENTLGIWAHRFPDVAEEIDHNYEQGTLMQSMEAISPAYDCAECGQTFQKLPRGAERANWCEHLERAEGLGARICRNVVFTGTGLIFGTRGKEGANPNAHLEVFQQEIAEFHEKAHRETSRTGTKDRQKSRRRRTSMAETEIGVEEYAELKARPTKEEFAALEQKLKDAENEVAEAKKKVEEAEIAQKKAEDEKSELEKKVETFEGEKAESELREKRLGGLGDGFMAKLGDNTKANLKDDAGKFEEEAWERRISELEELSGVKRDTKLKGSPKPAGSTEPDGESSAADEEFSLEEIASSAVGGGSEGEEPSANQRQSVARGLIGGGSKKSDD